MDAGTLQKLGGSRNRESVKEDPCAGRTEEKEQGAGDGRKRGGGTAGFPILSTKNCLTWSLSCSSVTI
jgi:hypothetical protein